MMGIEPTLVAWEATVLPLNYTRWPSLILCRFHRVGKQTGRASARVTVAPCRTVDTPTCLDRRSRRIRRTGGSAPAVESPLDPPLWHPINC